MSAPAIDPNSAASKAKTHRWVRLHVVGFFAVLGVAAGLVIVDSKVAEIIGDKSMPFFRTVLVVSVLLAGLGTRALLAWRSATVDLQGRIFLTVIGLVLLTSAAFGLSNCLQEIRESVKAQESRPPAVSVSIPIQNRVPRLQRAIKRAQAKPARGAS